MNFNSLSVVCKHFQLIFQLIEKVQKQSLAASASMCWWSNKNIRLNLLVHFAIYYTFILTFKLLFKIMETLTAMHIIHSYGSNSIWQKVAFEALF